MITSPLPLHVSTVDLNLTPTSVGRSFVSNPNVISISWFADLACYVPVSLPWPYPVNRVFWVNGTTITTSNANFGIFTKGGARIYSTGSTALVGASTAQYTTPSPPFILPAGDYFFAYACSSTTNRASGITGWTTLMLAHLGVLQQASNLALADPATFAAPSQAVYPNCGITRTQTGF